MMWKSVLWCMFFVDTFNQLLFCIIGYHGWGDVHFREICQIGVNVSGHLIQIETNIRYFKVFWQIKVFHIAMGWGCLTVFPQLLAGLERSAFLLTLTGGIFYTIGSVVYSLPCKKLEGKPFGVHEIFHCFVLAGTFFHFLVMFLYFV